MPQAAAVRSDFINLYGNFKPDLGVSYGEDHMRYILDAWERNYHKDVKQVFTNLHKEYLNDSNYRR